VGEKIVVLDSHQFNDNRVSKQIECASSKYPLLRLNFNFYPERKADSPDESTAHIFNVGKLSNPYLNGALFTLATMLGGFRKKAERMLRNSFVKEDDRVIFHVHDPYLLGLATGLSKRFPGSRVVYDRHEYYDAWDNHMGFSIPSYFERRYGDKVAELIFVSNRVERLPAIFRGKTVTVVPNYPFSSMFSGSKVEDKISALNAIDHINLGYFGTLNLNFDRDTGLLFDIAEKLMREDRRFTFTLAGRIYGDEIPLRIKAMAEEFGKRFSYLGEISMKEVVENAQRTHFGFLLIRPESPMFSESMPVSANKVYEYLLAGTIPVIRAVIEDRESVEKCSLIFGKDATMEDMVAEIRTLTGDVEKIRRLMAECREIGQRYSWENVSPRYIQVYERIFETIT
jgi:glycosyltransferase involved in cell wall biosynthesis